VDSLPAVGMAGAVGAPKDPSLDTDAANTSALYNAAMSGREASRRAKVSRKLELEPACSQQPGSTTLRSCLFNSGSQAEGLAAPGPSVPSTQAALSATSAPMVSWQSGQNHTVSIPGPAVSAPGKRCQSQLPPLPLTRHSPLPRLPHQRRFGTAAPQHWCTERYSRGLTTSREMWSCQRVLVPTHQLAQRGPQRGAEREGRGARRGEQRGAGREGKRGRRGGRGGAEGATEGTWRGPAWLLLQRKQGACLSAQWQCLKPQQFQQEGYNLSLPVPAQYKHP